MNTRLADARAEAERARREQIENDGYRRTRLRLLQNGYNFIRGGDVLRVSVSRSGARYAVEYGAWAFERDECADDGRLYHFMVDTERNREFLKGLVEAGIVEVADEVTPAVRLFATAVREEDKVSVIQPPPTETMADTPKAWRDDKPVDAVEPPPETTAPEVEREAAPEAPTPKAPAAKGKKPPKSRIVRMLDEESIA